MKSDLYILIEHHKDLSTTEMIRKTGHRIEIRILKQEIVEANHHISRQLNLPLASKLLYVERLIVVDGEARAFEKLYLNLNEIKGIENVNLDDRFFHDYLNKEKGINKLFNKEEVLIVKANETEKKMLDLDQEEEIILIKGIATTENDTPLEYYETAADTAFYRYRRVSSYE